MASISWNSGISADWSVAADWSTDTIPTSADDVTIAATGTYLVTIHDARAANSLTLNATTATLSDSGTLSLNHAFNLDAGTFDLASGGVIQGGTVVANGGTFLSTGGTLSGVAFQGTLSLAANFEVLTITGATTFSGTGGSGSGTINLTSQGGSTLDVLGNDTLDNATINIGQYYNNGAGNAVVNLDTAHTGAVLTLGSHLTITQTGSYALLTSTGATGDGIVNYGTINAGYSGGLLTINASYFTNDGTINVSNNDTVDLVGAPTAALIASITNTGGLVGIGGVVTGGTISSPTGGIGGMGGTLSGVAFQGTLSLAANFEVLTITGATTFSGTGGSGSGTINLTSQGGSTLDVLGNDTLDHATINIGQYYNNGAGNAVVNLDTAHTGAVLTLGSHLTITQTGSYALLTSTGATGDGIVNYGTINAGYSGGLLTINASYFTNDGTINVSNNDTVDLVGAPTAALIASITNTGGLVGIGGVVTGGTISSPTGGIGGMGGTLSGVAFQGTLSLAANFEVLTITGATTFSGTGGSGSGTINLTSQGGSTLDVLGNDTLDHATINIGQYYNNGAGNAVVNLDTAHTGAVLTLGSHLTITQTGSYALLTSTGATGDGIVNYGTINAGYSGGLLTINASYFTNDGTINVSNNDTVDLVGAPTAALIASITNTGGLVGIGGVVTGGTISSPTGGIGGMGGTLSGVAFQGTLSLAANFEVLTITGATTFSGTGGSGSGTINLTSQGGSTLDVLGNDTLDHATINIGQYYNNGAGNAVVNLDTAHTGAVLTLGSHLTITQTGSYALLTSTGATGDGIVNYGTINAGYSGGLLTINASYFTNDGTINVSNNDTVDLVGAPTAALIASITNTGGLVGIGGVVTGGTISSPTGGIGGMGGTLSGVAFQGTLSLAANFEVLTITGATTFSGTGGSGSGTINLTSQGGSTLDVLGNDTLDHATINIGQYYNNGAGNAVVNLDTAHTGAVLTLGSHLTITQTGSYALLTSTGATGDGIVNYGTINAGYSGGLLTINASYFTNDGTINVSNSETLIETSSDFVNNGKINVKSNGVYNASSGTFNTSGLVTVSGGTLSLGAIDNTGTIALRSGTLVLSDFTGAAGLGTVIATGGFIDLLGTVTAAQVNSLNAITTSGGAIEIGGTVNGGTLLAPSGGIGGAGGTLNNVAFDGRLDLTAPNAVLSIAGGLTMTGAGGSGSGTIRLVGSSASLIVKNSMTLGNATVHIGSFGGDTLSLGAAAETLTLASSLNLQQVGATAELLANQGSDDVINQGTISAGYAEGDFVINAATFTNSGSLSVDQGDTLDLSQVSNFTNLVGSVLTGGTITVGEASTLQLASGATITVDAATITLNGDGSVIRANGGVSLDSTLATIASGGTLKLLGGRDFTSGLSGGTFTDAGLLVMDGSTFDFASATAPGVLNLSSGTISGAGTIQSALSISGSSDVLSGSTIDLGGSLIGTGTLSISHGLTVDVDAGGSSTAVLKDSGVLVLAGTTLSATALTITANGELTGAGTISGTITDNGLIDATGGTLSVAGLAGLGGGTWSGNALEVDAASTLLVGSTIASDGGLIILSGTGSLIETTGAISLDTTLAAITTGGTLALLSNRNLSATANSGTFTNAGLLSLGGGTFTATKLLLNSGGTITGGGTIAAAIAVSGGVTLSGGTLVTTGSISGSGTLSVAAGEVLSLGTASSASTAVYDAGTVQISGGSFAAGQLTTGSAGVVEGFGTLSGTAPAAVLADAQGGTLTAAGVGTYSSGTLTAGRLEADAGSVLALATNLSITTESANVTLSGVGSVIESLNTTTSTEVTLDSSLKAIGAGGTLALQNGRSFSATANSGTFTDAGVLLVNGGTFTATSLIVAATGTLVDSGAISGALSNAGTVTIAAGSVLTLSNGGSLGGAIVGAGLLEVGAGIGVTGNGTLGTTVDVAGTVTASGGTLVIDGPITSTGTLTAAAGAVLQLADGGAFFGTVNGAGTVINTDLIDGVSQGISLAGTGTLGVTNLAAGDIYADNGNGVVMAGGTNVLNNAGNISGTNNGLSLSGGSSTVSNSGVISGDAQAAIAVTGSGTTTITNTGLIANYEASVAAISLSSASSATITNAGTIIGNEFQSPTTSEIAIQFGNGTNRLIVDPGAVFIGTVLGGTGANTLELAASSTSAGTISGLGGNFAGFTGIVVDSGANWTASGTSSVMVAAGLSIAAGGTLSLTGTLEGPITDLGLLQASVGTLAVVGTLGVGGVGAGTFVAASTAAVSFGALNIGAAGTAELNDAVATGETITFAAASGLLQLGDLTGFNGVVAGLQVGDTLSVTGMVGANVTVTAATNTAVGFGSYGTLTLAGNDGPGGSGLPALLGMLATEAQAGVISSINFATSGVPTLTLTQSQITADQAALRIVSAPYDLIVSGAGTETMYSASGADTVQLGTGATTVSPATGAVDILGTSSTTVPSGSFNLVFNGDSSVSTVNGGAGSYSISAGAGGGLFTGGSAGGNDFVAGTGNVTLNGAGNGDTFNLGAGTDIVNTYGADTVNLGTGVAAILAWSGATKVVGATSVSNPSVLALSFYGIAGINTVLGGAGTYYVDGGAGGGVFTGGSGGNNNLYGVTGNVTLTGSGNDDLLTGGTGNDVINAGPGANVTMSGGGGDDVFNAGAGSDTINVDGTDTVNLGSGIASIGVTSGSAVVVGSASVSNTGTYSLWFQSGANASTVLGAAGSYDINVGTGGGVFTGGSAGSNSIIGGNGSVTLTGGGNNDYLAAGSGNDVFNAGPGGYVVMSDGTGHNTLNLSVGIDVANDYGADTVNLGTGAADVFVWSGSTKVIGATSVSNPDNLSFYGFEGVNTVLGGAGTYYVDGGAGGGVFTGGSDGNNNLYGVTGNVTLTGGGNDDLLTGGTGNDVINAGPGANVTMSGGGGDDVFNAGAGSDTITVDGTDTVHLGSGISSVGVTSGSAVVVGSASVSNTGTYSLWFQGGANASTVLGGAGSYDISVGAGGGVFTGGSAGSNSIIGGNGSVTLTGGGNNDYLAAGSGNDVFNAGPGGYVITSDGTGHNTLNLSVGTDVANDYGTDTVNLGTGAAAVFVWSGSTKVIGATSVSSADNLSFYGFEGVNTVQGGAGTYYVDGGAGGGVFTGGSAGNNNLFGVTGSVTLTGGGSDDLLTGSSDGNDVITAAGSADTLVAGGGGGDLLAGITSASDIFSFVNEAGGIDTVTGLHSGDTLYFANATVASYASAHEAVAGGNTTITLADSTQIVLVGFTSSLSGMITHG